MNGRKLLLAGCLMIAFSASSASACAGQISCTLTAASEPKAQPWSQPARIEYTINNGQDDEGNEIPDSFAVDVNARLISPLTVDGSASWFGEIEWHKNNQQSKEQNEFAAALGLQFEMTSPPPNMGGSSRPLSLYLDGKVGYSRKAKFASASDEVCTVTPDLPACSTQYVESVRGTVVAAPYWSWMESDWFYRPLIAERPAQEPEGPPLVHAIGLDGTIFHDAVLENVVDPTTGTIIDGSVTGGMLRLSGSLTPRFADYRLNLRAAIQFITTFQRSAGRTDFPGDARLLTVSLDYNLGRLFSYESSAFRPSIGVTFTDGSDPLQGREDQQSISLGFKLGFS